MRGLSAEARRQRLLRKFYRTGQEGQWTRPFEGLPPDVRANLLNMAAVRGDELPVLSYFRDAEHWVLLTTEQVITWRPEHILRLPWSEIENATVDASHVSAALASGPDGKRSLERLRLLLRGGEAVELELEAGAAFLGFWNALKMVAALSSSLPGSGAR
jgi:hypothetical protein